MVEEVESLILEASVLDDFSKTLNELSKELAETDAVAEGSFPIDADVRIGEAITQLETLKQIVRTTGSEDIEFDTDVDKDARISVNARGVHNELSRLGRRLRELDSRETDIGVDFESLVDETGKLEAQIEALEEKGIDIDTDVDEASLRVKLEAIRGRLAALSNEDIDVDVDALVSEAITELAAIRAQLSELEDEYKVSVDIDREGGVEQMMERLQKRKRSAAGVDLDNPLHARQPWRRSPEIDFDRGGGFRGWRERIGDRSQVLEAGRSISLPGGGDIRRGDRKPVREAMREFSQLKVSMGMFMNVLASLLPLMFVFVGALPSAIAGLVGLAGAAVAAGAALGAIPLLGLGGMLFAEGQMNMENIEDQLESLEDAFLEAFGPLMEAFIPVAQSLFRNLEFAIRDIARNMTGLLDLTDEVTASFQWLAEVAGPAIADFVDFADAAVPVMSFIVGGLADIDWFELFASLIADTLPLLHDFAGLVMNILPALYQLSLGFFIIANAVTSVISLVTQVITAFGMFPFGAKAVGVFVGAIMVAITATALWSRVTGELMTKLATKYVTVINSAIHKLAAYIGVQHTAAGATWHTYLATAALVGVLTFGLQPVLSAISSAFFGVGGSVDKATNSMKQFRKESQRINGTSVGVGTERGERMGYGKPGAGTTIVAPDRETGNSVAQTYNWQQRGSSTTDQSDVENRQHSG